MREGNTMKATLIDEKDNVAVAAVARELACFIWGLMTNNITSKEEGTKAA